MDNPEEVLQALDEFSKMRPSEIPRELEDYLCFVAKTGDPVYQWSLIKPLFREKLVRVMTDFYENCPALDLASSPNLEHFNYDIMKCNLLELLESFASAPFTVQRICELLTSPRKEYNRVDKFMRAIEKNILVVSTKEPGPAARRSENGESILNGSIDDENLTPNNQSSQEVEMESWVKDCAAEANSSSLAAADASLVDSIAPLNKMLGKDASNSASEDSSSLPAQESKDQSRLEMTVSSFITAAHDMSNTPIISTPNSAHESANSNNHSNSSEKANEVPEAIINEDTSSQPSLDSEADSNFDSNAGKKFQTTFESKDFAGKLSDELSDKFYAGSNDSSQEESGKNDEKLNDEFAKCMDEKINQDLKDDDSKSDDESKSSFDSNSESASPEKRPRLDIEANGDAGKGESNRNFSVVTSQAEAEAEESRLIPGEEKIKSEKDENLEGGEKNNLESDSHEVQPEATFVAEEPKFSSTNSAEKPGEETTEAPEASSDASKPIVEEPPLESSSSSSSSSSTSSPSSSSNESTLESSKAENKQTSVVIQEAMDDDSKLFSSSVNDPIPIVEEPKDEVAGADPVPVEISPVEISDYTKSDSENPEKAPVEQQEETKVEEKNLECLEGNHDAELRNLLPRSPDLLNTPMEKEESMETESMEVDNEEPSAVFQDEPMDQESGDQIRS